MKDSLYNEKLIHVIDKEMNQEEVFAFVCKHLEENEYVTSEYFNALKEREKEYPTGLQTNTYAVAIPHVDTGYVKKPVIAVTKFEHPVEWGNMEDMDEKLPVSLVFTLALSKNEKHMTVLGSIIQLIQNDEVMKRIMESDSSFEILHLLERRSAE